jgi:hypothetical protein
MQKNRSRGETGERKEGRRLYTVEKNVKIGAKLHKTWRDELFFPEPAHSRW